MSIRQLPHRFSVAQYERMIALCILKEDDRVELIRGEIVAKMPIEDPHIVAVDRLNKLMHRLVGDLADISIQNPISLADSEPEPDVVLKRHHAEFYGKPKPDDILLLIEVSDSSLDLDREVKGPIYAENGIADFWIVNLIENCLEVRRQPRADGTFGDVRTLWAGDTIEMVGLPGVMIPVAELLGKYP